jgi:hypothetical protein
MADRPWRTAQGLIAVLLWSFFIGFPVLAFHVNSMGLDPGQHVHAAVLFVSSQVLVFWLAARPSRKLHPSSRAVFRAAPNVVRPVANPAARDQQVWEAELVSQFEGSSSQGNGSAPQPSADVRVTRMIVANYLGSSRARVVYVEPGGTHCSLLPGQELEIKAASRGALPAFRIVESDLATQVYVDGVDVTVTVTTVGPSVYKVASHNQGVRPELRT